MALEDVSQVRSLKINGVNIQLALFLRLNPKHMQVFQSQVFENEIIWNSRINFPGMLEHVVSVWVYFFKPN